MTSKAQPITQTTNTSQTIDPWLDNAAQTVSGNALNLPGYTPYSGQGVAGLNPTELQALGLASSSAGAAGGLLGSAVPGLTGLTGFSAPTVTAAGLNGQIQGLLNPMTQADITATNAQIQQNTNQQQAAVNAGIAGQGAFGNNRTGIADAVTQNLGGQTMAATDANINQSNYQNALTAALGAAQGNQLAALGGGNIQLGAGNALTGAATGLSGINLNSINGLLGTGQLAQNTGTAQDQFNYQQYLNSMALPDQQAQAQASVLGSLPHDTTGGSATQGTVYTNPLLSGLAGVAGIAGLNSLSGGAIGSGLSGLGSSLGSLLPLVALA